MLQDGDVLLSRSNTRNAVGYIGQYRDVGVPAAYPDLMMRLVPRENVLSASYLVRALQSARGRRQIEAAAVGTSGSMQKLNKAAVESLSLLLPPLPEQHQIAAVLDTIDDSIRKTEQMIVKLKQVKQGLLHDLLTRGIDENGKLRDPQSHPEHFRDSPLGPIPEEWELAPCRELCREIVVGIVIKPTQYYRDEGVPMLRSANVCEDGLRMEDLRFMSPSDHMRMSKSSVAPGDLVTVRTGYPGTTAVIPPSVSTANCIDIIISRVGPRLMPEFLAMWVNSDRGKGQILRKQGGLAQQHFNVGEMKELMVSVPSIAEQERLFKTVQASRHRIRVEEQQAAALRLLKAGLMEDLLTGRVRVTPLLSDAP